MLPIQQRVKLQCRRNAWNGMSLRIASYRSSQGMAVGKVPLHPEQLLLQPPAWQTPPLSAQSAAALPALCRIACMPQILPRPPDDILCAWTKVLQIIAERILWQSNRLVQASVKAA